MKLTIWLMLICLGLLLAACKPSYPNRDAALPIYPTISSDGKLLVVLDHREEETPRLRIKWLDRDEPWQEMPAPKYTSSIRFGLIGYHLLLTHARPGPEGASQLSRWDPSQPTKPSEILYEGTRVAFPVEVSPGRVLVRMCPQPPGEKACARGHDLVWALIQDGQATPFKETLGMLPLGTPNVTKDGFFWNFDDDKWKPTSGPGIPLGRTKIISHSFPGKEAPQFDDSVLDSTTGRMRCDRKAHRCLLSYLTEDRINSAFVYGFRALEGRSTCILPEIKGYQDDFSITPDGRAAVMSLSRVSEEPRHVVVLRFQAGQCAPISIQHINFKEVNK